MKGGIRLFYSRLLRVKEIGSLSGLLIIIIIFSLLSGKFLTRENFIGIFTITSELGIIAIGVCFLMIAGEFDLSVGSVFAVAPMIGALLGKIGVPMVGAFFVSLFASAVIGYFNGLIVIKTGIPSFIVTLGAMMFYRGVLLAVSGGFTITFMGEDTAFLDALGGKIFMGMRASGIWFIAATIIFSIVLNNTKYGNHVFAVGGNPGTAKALGINVNRVKLINFVLCSVMAGLAGFTMFGRFHSIDPTAGSLHELEAIASAVIGGALLTGGYGSIVGAFIGAFLIGVMRSGLILAGAPSYWYQGFIGVVLVISVIINTKIRKAVAG
ncbi:MAG: ABC transporter permease [Spirochaetes bacterium]|nr:MAG: ABC transporter permease [Spirochaetota bacterium]